MTNARYYDISILLVDKSGTKSIDSLILPGKDKFDARKRAESYIKQKYLDFNWKVKKVFSIRESSFRS